MNQTSSHLSRKLGLLGLLSTGVCSMIGASIYVVPFMIQRNVPGIGPFVLPAFLFAAVPALFAAISYAALSSSMPRAGGSYLYASRSLHPYLGFIASFCQWFGLSTVIGVISYLVIPFIRDLFFGLGWDSGAVFLDVGVNRVLLSLMLLWFFAGVNMLGLTVYQRTVIPLMLVMFGLGAIVIILGLSFDHTDFRVALQSATGKTYSTLEPQFEWNTFLAAAALLFSSFIGFDAIAQAGGEAVNPRKNLPRAIALAILVVGGFYFLFTYAVYHAVPWEFVAQEAQASDLTAAGLLSFLLPDWIAVIILFGAGLALLNDLPAMILSVSRLVFSWAEDGIFPAFLSRTHPVRNTPIPAIILSTSISTVGVLGSHFAGDFFLGIDIMVTAMMINFLFICLSLFFLKQRNPDLAKNLHLLPRRYQQVFISLGGSAILLLFLIVHLQKDLQSSLDAWYFHSTYILLIVLSLASVLFYFRWRKMKTKGIDLKSRFSTLPEE
ncbi:APC family permease [Algoriphagus namhaensis]